MNALQAIALSGKGMGWEIEAIRKTSADEYVVLVKRDHSPIPGKQYSTHKFSTANNSFYYGHYDMDLATATKSFEERA